MRRTRLAHCSLMIALTGVFLLGPSHSLATANDPRPRLLVLGIDGMDAGVLRELLDEGKMPNIARIASQGTFVPLGTSMPPLSPVAWSNMISGAEPDTHQIYDFFHRNPDSVPPLPYNAMSDVIPPATERAIPLGRWQIPLTGGTQTSFRRGPAFWEYLVENGINTTIYRIPANYPPPEVQGSGDFACLCGMGTPDLLGGYGEFTFFSPDAPLPHSRVSGGTLVYWFVQNHRATGTLRGPPNFLLKPSKKSPTKKLEVDFEVIRDPQAPVAKVIIQDQVILLNEGEWSDWVPIDFETGIPASPVVSALQVPTSLRAIVRFHLRQVHPKLEVYVTPLNIDPIEPANPISTPNSFAGRIAELSGRYYTTGIPQDTKALRNTDAFNEDWFLGQCRILLDERIKQYRHALEDFKDGVLFFYFGTVDQLSHIFWRDRDPEHPGRDPEQGDRYANVIEDSYLEMDQLIGEALDALRPNDTVMVMSDHGFSSFRRGFNLNTWLIQNGYMKLRQDIEASDDMLFGNVDWGQTKAYALGLNSFYVNLRGREKRGIVNPGEAYTSLMAELVEKLEAVRDKKGQKVVERVYRVDKIHPNADPNVAPDMMIGYALGYRSSWATALPEGRFPTELFEDNMDRWCGDHGNAHDLVPGILVTNRKITNNQPTLSDIGPTILGLYGISPPSAMTGRPLFGDNK